MKTIVKTASENNLFRQSDLRLALETLQKGGIIAFPTDTVYGLAALVEREDSIVRLYEIKARSSQKAIAVLVAKKADVNQVASSIGGTAQRLMDAFWPGALTLILPRARSLPAILSPKPTIGVRMPNHAAALQLLALSGALAVTSANLSEQASASSAAEVLLQLDGKFELLLDGGKTLTGVASTVVDCTESAARIVREGPISQEDIRMALL